ncbi:MAG: hypothetical protein Q8L55_08210 [Phycisphaerales bacterium]|nr:hypothetical protein [Phycisphaerales bacterium]
MTTFVSRTPPAASTQQPTGAPGRSTTTCVRWLLARAEADGGPAALAITIDDRSAHATLTPAGGEKVRLAYGGPVSIEHADGLQHFTVAGIVALTLRCAPGAPPQLLYARTPLLESLGIRGGCIERPQLDLP